MTRLLLLLGKVIASLSRAAGKGNGSTWPGEIALRVDPHILKKLLPIVNSKSILVAGTNGKTTTAAMILHVLRTQSDQIIANPSGANLINGLVSAFIQKSSLLGGLHATHGVLEVDEATLPHVLHVYKDAGIPAEKLTIVLLNLFRDQLDRYGEVDSIARKWGHVLAEVPHEATIILNSDDPQIAFLGKHTQAKVHYFGINKPKEYLSTPDHATDSTNCLACGRKLFYQGTYFSHIGVWRCPSCGNSRPKPTISGWKSPLPGLYNEYNTLAAVGALQSAGIPDPVIKRELAAFQPAFGRQEELEVDVVTVKLFLSKNPAGLNASLRTVLDFKPKRILLLLNDRIPDGRDISWIWDADFEMIPPQTEVIISGDRAYDLGVRIKYALGTGHSTIKIFEQSEAAILAGVSESKKKEILFVLATYSAMLEVRKIIKGRKIL